MQPIGRSRGEPLDKLYDAVVQFVAMESATTRSYQQLHHDALAALHRICSAVLDCEDAGCERADIIRVLEPVRRIHSRSPFVRRLQSWPRGYPGDFETVEYIHRAENGAPESTIERHCEAYSLNFPIAQQHRNKIRHQANAIVKTLIARRRPRILAMACGGCPDFREVLPHLERSRAELWLNDADPSALEFARKRLATIGARLHFEEGNALQLMRRWARGPAFHLILAGGLFDYLQERHAIFLIANAWKLLSRRGGTFFLTNIAAGNPYRALIEYVGDWFLIERSEPELRDLIERAGVPRDAVSIRLDETRLAWLVEMTKSFGDLPRPRDRY
ncbi:MAG TPA: class I SAM-dependent methyltransferase [Thermoanaerobaculia bacterium]